MRIGVMQVASGRTFCLVRNISSSGVQLKVFTRVRAGERLRLQVGDGDAIDGTVVWVRQDLVGVKLDDALSASSLMRMSAQIDQRRRRAVPRIQARTHAVVKSDGRTLSARLIDIGSGGAQLSLRSSLRANGRVTLIIPTLPPLEAFVCWSGPDLAGVRFRTPVALGLLAGWLSSHSVADPVEPAVR
jgi:hypothetical protein